MVERLKKDSHHSLWKKIRAKIIHRQEMKPVLNGWFSGYFARLGG
jgi:hypothetical protein